MVLCLESCDCGMEIFNFFLCRMSGVFTFALPKTGSVLRRELLLREILEKQLNKMFDCSEKVYFCARFQSEKEIEAERMVW